MAYETYIVADVGCREDEAGLVEDEMRSRTGGCLDHLRPAAFAKLARECYRDLYEGVGLTSI